MLNISHGSEKRKKDCLRKVCKEKNNRFKRKIEISKKVKI